MDQAGDFVVALGEFGPGRQPLRHLRPALQRRGRAAGRRVPRQHLHDRQSTQPGVAMDAAGDFVVAWESSGQDGSGYGVYAQRYNAAGAPQGGEFRVNTYTTGNQVDPAVAMDPAGDFVVAWQSDGQDGSGYGIYAQRYNAAGRRRAANSASTPTRPDSQICARRWRWIRPATSSSPGRATARTAAVYGVYAQRYNAAGAPQGGEFRVNTYTTGDQGFPAVAMDAAGDFVVAWQSDGQDGSGYGVYAQRLQRGGRAAGRRVPRQHLHDRQPGLSAAVAMDPAGDFVVAWDSYGQDGSGCGVYAQAYRAGGVPDGGEFRVNTYTTGNQVYPAVAMDAAGDFVVAWQSYGQDGSGYGVYAQRYRVTAPPQVSATQINDGTAQRSRVTSLTVTFSAQVTFAGTPGAAFTLTRNSDGAAVSFTATANVVGGVTVVTLNGFTGGVTEFGSLADGRYTLTALASQISAGGGALDGNGDGTGGDNYVLVGSPGTAPNLFRLLRRRQRRRHRQRRATSSSSANTSAATSSPSTSTATAPSAPATSSNSGCGSAGRSDIAFHPVTGRFLFPSLEGRGRGRDWALPSKVLAYRIGPAFARSIFGPSQAPARPEQSKRPRHHAAT